MVLCYYLLWSAPVNNVLILYRVGMRMKTSGCGSLAWFNSTTENKSRDALPKMWKVLRRCFVQWNENIPKIMKICFHALIASEKRVSFICTAYQASREISTLQMQKRQNQSRVEDEYERELAEHAGGVFQWVWRYSSKVVNLGWTFLFTRNMVHGKD